jgi:hypothetical protein
MNKIWYINQSGKNKGPFTSKEILRFKEQGLIKSFTLCWKAGMDEWKPFFEVESQILPPVIDLPPVPDLPDLPAIPTEPAKKAAPKLDDLLPEIPQDEMEAPAFEEIAEIEDNLDIEEYEDDEDDEESELINMMPDDIPLENRSFPLFSSLAGAFFCFVFIGACALFFIGDVKNELVFKNVSLDVLKSLQKEVKTDKFFVNFGLDKSGEVVFAKTNLAADAIVDVKFNLVNDALQKDEVSFISSSISRKGSIRFDDFTFKNGDKLVQGKYKVKIQAVVNDPAELIKNLVLNRPKKYIFEDTVYLIPGSKKDYLERVEKLKINKILNNKKNYAELDQKLQTIETLITSISLHYRTSLQKTWGRYAGEEFQKRYSRYAGPLLQKMILDDFEDIVKKSHGKLHVQQSADQIHKLAKDVAAWAADLKSLLDRYAKLNSKKRKKLKAKMELKRDQFKENVSTVKEFMKTQ